MEVKTIVLIENMKKYFLKYQVANEKSNPENIILINGVKHEVLEKTELKQ